MSGFTFHGGRLDAAQAHYGGDDWIDLSTGINPRGWPGANTLAIDWRALPGEAALHALEAAAASYLGVDPAHVCALPGTETGLRLLGSILPGPAVHAAPAYRTHGEMLHPCCAASTDEMADVRDATLILANPNNPDGRVIAPDRLRGMLAGLDGHWLVIDEAFADANPAISLAGDVGDDVPLIVFRSFGKFFGLAGVRLGFIVAPRAIVARYRRLLGSWPVSTAALAIGTAAYGDAGWIAATRAVLPARAATLDALLARHGYRATGACPLFRLIAMDDASGLFDRLARRFILTRPFDHDPRWLRLGLPADDHAFARLNEALAGG